MPRPKFNLPAAERTKLPNGITLLVQPLPLHTSVAVALNAVSGSRDEHAEESGLCHLLEHMLFQGTRSRDTRELSRVIQAVGGNLDACTGRESTTFYAKLPVQHLELALDVLADMLENSTMASKALAKEKEVILEEINMCEDTPDELVNDLLFQALWPDHPLGYSILGTQKSLARVNRERVQEFFKRHYQPSRLMISIAGPVTLAGCERLVRKYFKSKAAPVIPADGPAIAGQPVPLVLRPHKLEQVHVCLGVRGLPYAQSRRTALLALSNILGGGPNSRLFYEVREKRALAYSIFSFVDFYRDTGLAGVYLACQPNKLRETLQVVRHEIARMIERPITRQEWLDVREQMRGNYQLSLESSSAHMWQLLQQETYTQQHPSQAAVLRSIARVSREDIQSLARELFRQPYALSVVGPVKEQSWMNAKI